MILLKYLFGINFGFIIGKFQEQLYIRMILNFWFSYYRIIFAAIRVTTIILSYISFGYITATDSRSVYSSYGDIIRALLDNV
jgi:hypothetical protein